MKGKVKYLLGVMTLTVTPAFGRWKQEDNKFEASLGCIVSLSQKANDWKCISVAEHLSSMYKNLTKDKNLKYL